MTMVVAMGKFGLEAFKMALYVAAPVAVTVMVVADRDTLWCGSSRSGSYVVYHWYTGSPRMTLPEAPTLKD